MMLLGRSKVNFRLRWPLIKMAESPALSLSLPCVITGLMTGKVKKGRTGIREGGTGKGERKKKQENYCF